MFCSAATIVVASVRGLWWLVSGGIVRPPPTDNLGRDADDIPGTELLGLVVEQDPAGAGESSPSTRPATESSTSSRLTSQNGACDLFGWTASRCGGANPSCRRPPYGGGRAEDRHREGRPGGARPAKKRLPQTVDGFSNPLPFPRRSTRRRDRRLTPTASGSIAGAAHCRSSLIRSAAVLARTTV